LLLEGSLQRKLPELVIAWEKAFEGGIYPLGHKTFPRVEALACIGRLAYETACISSAGKKRTPTSRPMIQAAPAPIGSRMGIRKLEATRPAMASSPTGPGMMDFRGYTPARCRLLMAVKSQPSIVAIPCRRKRKSKNPLAPHPANSPTARRPRIPPHGNSSGNGHPPAAPLHGPFTPLGAEGPPRFRHERQGRAQKEEIRQPGRFPRTRRTPLHRLPAAAAKAALTTLPWQTIHQLPQALSWVIAPGRCLQCFTEERNPNLPPVRRTCPTIPTPVQASRTRPPLDASRYHRFLKNDSPHILMVPGPRDARHRFNRAWNPTTPGGLQKLQPRFLKSERHPINSSKSSTDAI